LQAYFGFFGFLISFPKEQVPKHTIPKTT